MKARTLLGRRTGSAFSFDIRIRMGAGAYICGEESALIESAEGAWHPRNRRRSLSCPVTDAAPPSSITGDPAPPASCSKAPAVPCDGTDASTGVALSVAGDCERPGIYEVPWVSRCARSWRCPVPTTRWRVQVGGPSGDLCVGAAVRQTPQLRRPVDGWRWFTIFSHDRDPLSIKAQPHDILRERNLRLLRAVPRGHDADAQVAREDHGGQRHCARLESDKSTLAASCARRRCGSDRPRQTRCSTLIISPNTTCSLVRAGRRRSLAVQSPEFASAESNIVAGRRPNLQRT